MVLSGVARRAILEGWRLYMTFTRGASGRTRAETTRTASYHMDHQVRRILRPAIDRLPRRDRLARAAAQIRVPVVVRKVRRSDVHPQAMTRLEAVGCGPQVDLEPV